MTTALTLFGLSSAATTIATAGNLTATGGGASTATFTTLIGQSTGFDEFAAQGSTSAWAALNSLQSPTGMGFLFDVTTLEGQQIVAGSWTPTFRLHTSVGSIVADLYARFYLFESGIFVPLSSPQQANYSLLGAQNIPSSATTYAFPAVTLPQVSCVTGCKVYVDLWANITSNSTGSNSATMVLATSSTSQGLTTCQVVTPGYAPLTQSQLQTLYTFGGFILNDRVNYLLQRKDFSLPEVKQTLFKIARQDGMKKTGQVVNEKLIPVTIYVLANSRPDLEAKFDALQQALMQQQQNLVLHTLDGRYYVADALKEQEQFIPGKLIGLAVPVTFVAQNPYTYAASSLSFTDSGAASLVSGNVYQRTGITLWRQGTSVAYPQIVVTNNTVSNNTTLTTGLTLGTPATSLTVAALPNNALSGDSYTLNDGSGHTQNVVLSAPASSGGTALSVVSFTPNFSYPGSGATTVQRVTTITSVTINDSTDARSVTFSGITLTNAPQALTVICDPTATNGTTGTIAGGNPLNFSGIWPLMGNPQSAWTVQATCLSVPTIQTVWTWTPRFLS